MGTHRSTLIIHMRLNELMKTELCALHARFQPTVFFFFSWQSWHVYLCQSPLRAVCTLGAHDWIKSNGDCRRSESGKPRPESLDNSRKIHLPIYFGIKYVKYIQQRDQEYVQQPDILCMNAFVKIATMYILRLDSEKGNTICPFYGRVKNNRWQINKPSNGMCYIFLSKLNIIVCYRKTKSKQM